LKHICIDSAFFPPGGTWVWVGRTTGEKFPTWSGSPLAVHGADGYCFTLYKVPDLPAVVLNTGVACTVAFTDPTLTNSHCTAQTYDFDACDPDATGSPMNFTLVTGPGSIDPVSGVWVANTLPVGTHTVTVTAGTGDPVNMTVTATNTAPVISGGCGTNTITNTGAVKTVQMAGTDADACDPKNWTIVSITPAVGATATINASGLVTFSATAAGAYTVVVGLSDGIIAQPVTCEITFAVSAGSLYGVRIEKTHGTYQGLFETVDSFLKASMLIRSSAASVVSTSLLAMTIRPCLCSWSTIPLRRSIRFASGSISPIVSGRTATAATLARAAWSTSPVWPNSTTAQLIRPARRSSSARSRSAES